jgi:hypothetical protein
VDIERKAREEITTDGEGKAEQEKEKVESEVRLRKQKRQAEKDRVADERAVQNEDNWKDLKQWREKESGRIDDCHHDIDHLLESMQDVKLDLNMQGKNLRERRESGCV